MARETNPLAMADGREVRLFVLHDEARRSVFAIVALPPDDVSAGLRARLEHLLEVRFGGTSVGHHIETEFDPARFHFTIHVPEGELPDVDLAAVEQEVAEASRSWDDRLSDAPVGIHGSPAGHQLAARYSALFPEYYKSASRSIRRCSTSPSSSSWAAITRMPWRCRTSGTWPNR